MHIYNSDSVCLSSLFCQICAKCLTDGADSWQSARLFPCQTHTVNHRGSFMPLSVLRWSDSVETQMCVIISCIEFRAKLNQAMTRQTQLSPSQYVCVTAESLQDKDEEVWAPGHTTLSILTQGGKPHRLTHSEHFLKTNTPTEGRKSARSSKKCSKVLIFSGCHFPSQTGREDVFFEGVNNSGVTLRTALTTTENKERHTNTQRASNSSQKPWAPQKKGLQPPEMTSTWLLSHEPKQDGD